MPWQTWNVRSVLSHVHMPEAFAIQLGLFEFAECKHLREALIGRPPQREAATTANDLVGHEEIHSEARLVDAVATRLHCAWRGIEWSVTTARDGDDLVALVEPARLPQTPPLLLVEGGVLWGRPGGGQREGASLRLSAPQAECRVFTTAEPVAGGCAGLLTPHLALRLDTPVGISTGHQRSLAEIRRLCNAGLERRDAALAAYGPGAELAGAIHSALGWTTIHNAQEDRLETTVSRVWAARNGGSIIFCWDSFFAAMMAAAIGDGDLAAANLAAIIGTIDRDGYVPNLHNAIGAETLGQSQPPVGALALRYCCQALGREPALEHLDRLLRWNRWWPTHRDLDGYLCWGSRRETPIIGTRYETECTGHLQGAKFESGLDNSPMFDDADYDEDLGVMRQADVGLMSLYVRDCQDLAVLCRAAGRGEEAEELTARAAAYGEALDTLWDDATGIYRNRDLRTGALSPRVSPTSFYPLLTGRVPAARVRRLVDEHLIDDGRFWGKYVLPAISRDDPAFPDQSYWRGRVWAPLNLLVYWGLLEAGENTVAHELAERGAALFLEEWRAKGYVAENYNAITGAGGEVANSDPFNPWGALLALIGLVDGGHVAPLTTGRAAVVG